MTGNRISARIAAVSPSATLAVDAKAKALKAAGENVIGFGAGEPDFPTPDAHRRGGRRRPAGTRRTTSYTPTAGLPELRAGDGGQDGRDSGYEVTAAQVLVTNGGKQAVANAFATLFDPGDEVLVPAPYWTTYPESIVLAGGVPVVVPTDAASGFRVTVDQLEAARTPGTKVLLFVSPSNPTGAVYPRAEIEAIGRWAVEHGIWVVTDEIYEHLVYGGAEHHSMPVRRARAGRPLRRRQRGGQDLRHDRLAGRLDDRADRRDRGGDQPAVPRDLQRVQRLPAGRAGRASPGTCRRWPMMREAFDRRRIDHAPHAQRDRRRRVACSPRGRSTPSRRWRASRTPATGAHAATSSAELAELAIEEAKVAVVPGEAFGAPGYFRLSYALGDDDLVEGITRLADLFAGG